MATTPTRLDPSQDPEFKAASMRDKVAYLSSLDPDFAKASPQDQAGYVNHLLGNDTSSPTQGPGLTGPINPSLADASPLTRTLDAAGAGLMAAPGAIAQTVLHPIDTANSIADSVESYLDPKTRPTWEGIKSVLPEAIGGGIGSVAAGEAPRLALSATRGITNNVLRDPATGNIKTPYEAAADKILGPDPFKPKSSPATPIPEGTNYGTYLRDKAAADAEDLKARKPIPLTQSPNMAGEGAAAYRAGRKGGPTAPPNPFPNATPTAPETMPSTSPTTPSPATSDTSSSFRSGTASFEVPGISAQAGKGPVAPPVEGESGSVPKNLPDPNTVLTLPEPKPSIPGVPNNMGSVPRESLFDAADRGVAGAGPQIQSLGQRVLYLPRDIDTAPPKFQMTFPDNPATTFPPPTFPAIPSEGVPPPAPTGTPPVDSGLPGAKAAPPLSASSLIRPRLVPPQQ